MTIKITKKYLIEQKSKIIHNLFRYIINKVIYYSFKNRYHKTLISVTPKSILTFPLTNFELNKLNYM